MEKEKRRTLRLLDVIEHNGQVSQRELSKKLGISLGLVNLFIRRLIRDGYFEVVGLPSGRLTYALTSKGLAEKSRLATEYLDYALGFYRDVRKTVQKKLRELEDQQIREIILYGVGDIAELIYVCLQGSSINLVGVVDKEDAGGIFFGHEIHAPEKLSKLPLAPILITSLEEHGDRFREIMKSADLNREVFTIKL